MCIQLVFSVCVEGHSASRFKSSALCPLTKTLSRSDISLFLHERALAGCLSLVSDTDWHCCYFWPGKAEPLDRVTPNWRLLSCQCRCCPRGQTMPHQWAASTDANRKGRGGHVQDKFNARHLCSALSLFLFLHWIILTFVCMCVQILAFACPLSSVFLFLSHILCARNERDAIF